MIMSSSMNNAAMAARFSEYRLTTSPMSVDCSRTSGSPASKISPSTEEAFFAPVPISSFTGRPLLVADARIEHPIQDVYHEVCEDDERGEQHRQTHHDGVIPVAHTTHEVLAEAGYGEHVLGDERPRDHKTQKGPRLSDNGDERVAQNMLQHHRAERKTLRHCRPDVVLLKSLKHASSGQPREVGG